jgi:Uma2 family endonuclease
MLEKTIEPAPATPTERRWPPEQGQWTYEDWLRLPDDGFRYEVLNGELIMTPPPTVRHQDVIGALFTRMRLFAVERQLGKVFVAPCGVRLPEQPVPVQPDIFFVKAERRDIVGEEYVEGAPDLVVEVLSPSNWTYDRREKFQAYLAAGVPEYWIVDYRACTVEVFVREGGVYALIDKFGQGQTVCSQVLTGFEITVDELFAE